MGGGEIDVVVPALNAEKYIENALRSIQQQTRPAARIIIADDGSTDGTARIVESLMRSDDRIILLKLFHAGVSAARNAGVLASSAPFVAFLDADDIWLPDKLERQMEAFERSGPDTGFVHSSYFLINADGARLAVQHVFLPRLRGDIFLPLLQDGYVLSGSASSVLVRRDVLDKAGHFDERLFHGEDWDLWIRLARISRADFTPEAVVGIRVHDQSAQRRARPGREAEFFHQQLLIYAKWEPQLAEDPRFKASLRKRAVDAILPVLRTPRVALRFWWSLAASDSPFVRSVFRNPAQFWLDVGYRVLRAISWRVTRKVGLIDR
jgi:glycosyltransferase involved in cell wall biosynthesis